MFNVYKKGYCSYIKRKKYKRNLQLLQKYPDLLCKLCQNFKWFAANARV